jgi:hypothetical protein
LSSEEKTKGDRIIALIEKAEEKIKEALQEKP